MASQQKLKDALIDIAEDNVARALRDGDMITTRWFLDRKGRDRGYGAKVDQEDVTPINPQIEARRQVVKAALADLIETRARAGLPPLMRELLIGADPKKTVD